MYTYDVEYKQTWRRVGRDSLSLANILNDRHF